MSNTVTVCATHWIKVYERKPDIEGGILVYISGKVILGSCYYPKYDTILHINHYYCDFEMNRPDKNLVYPDGPNIGQGWIMPKFFKEPDLWMPIPRIPEVI